MLLVWKHPQICKFSFDQIMTPRVGWGHNRGGSYFYRGIYRKKTFKIFLPKTMPSGHKSCTLFGNTLR